MALVIKSESERGYWSNEIGWVYDVESATKFTPKTIGAWFPITRGRDATAIKYSKKLPKFKEEGEGEEEEEDDDEYCPECQTYLDEYNDCPNQCEV